jgi:hypothetical protein
MPRIRDLGINVIPATMRPPEIGAGGGFDVDPQAAEYPFHLCDNNSCLMQSACMENSAHVCESTSCTGSSAREDKCVASPPGCQGNTCANNSCAQASTKRETSGLTDGAVAELRRHLHARIATQLEN